MALPGPCSLRGATADLCHCRDTQLSAQSRGCVKRETLHVHLSAAVLMSTCICEGLAAEMPAKLTLITVTGN